MTPWQDCPAVERASDRVSGAWVFRGTRVPVATLFENLKDGATIEEFLEWFPGVSRSQVGAVLDTSGFFENGSSVKQVRVDGLD